MSFFYYLSSEIYDRDKYSSACCVFQLMNNKGDHKENFQNCQCDYIKQQWDRVIFFVFISAVTTIHCQQ